MKDIPRHVYKKMVKEFDELLERSHEKRVVVLGSGRASGSVEIEYRSGMTLVDLADRYSEHVNEMRQGNRRRNARTRV